MMRRFLACLFAALLLRPCAFAQQDWKGLDAKLDEYFHSLEAEPASVKKQECDFLISACTDRATLDHVALKAYNHFFTSRVMGDEEVAIYLTDNWFATGKASMASEVDLLNAKLYADMNRHSLLGMKAPEVVLQDPSGESCRVPVTSGRLAVLFFHDTSCATCKVENLLLRKLFSAGGHDLDFMAVYTGSDRKAWEGYISSMEDLGGKGVNVRHYWDPDGDSDFELLYGVLQTPAMFLLSEDGIILGRKLDTPALEQLLEHYDPAVEYGSKDYTDLYDTIFGLYGDSLSVAGVKEVAEHIKGNTLAKGDVREYKALSGSLLYYLGASDRGALRQGALYVADSLVLSRPGVWRSRDDSLRVVSYASMLKELLSRNAVGSKVPPLKLPGTLVVANGSRRECRRRIDRFCRDTYLVFYSPGCTRCKAFIEGVGKSPGARYFLVDVDSLMERDESLAGAVMDSFDLTVLPHALLLGRHGVVKALELF